jgi:hypothetical protein
MYEKIAEIARRVELNGGSRHDIDNAVAAARGIMPVDKTERQKFIANQNITRAIRGGFDLVQIQESPDKFDVYNFVIGLSVLISIISIYGIVAAI